MSKIFTLILFLIFLLKYCFSLSISPDNKKACFLYTFNKYYLFNLEENKIVKKSQIQDYYENVFFISPDKVMFCQQNKIVIMDSVILNKESEFSINYEIKNIKVTNYTEKETFFFAISDFLISYYNYNYENKKLKLIFQKKLNRYFDDKMVNDKILVANTFFLSIFEKKQFLFFKWLNQKDMKFRDNINSFDITSNKIAILHYTFSGKRKVTFYTLNGLEIKSIPLEGKYRKLWFNTNNKDIILYDKTNTIKILSIDGTIKESEIFGDIILDMEKFNKGFLVISETTGEKEINFSIFSSN